MKRIELVKSYGLKSVYSKKNKLNDKLDISCFNNLGQKGNYITPDMFEALKLLNEQIEKEKGELLIIDLFRSWETQSRNRKLYETKKKKDFVAKPGQSFHNAGRSVDISVKDLNYSGVDKDKWLQKFWDQCKPLGFYPIINIPDLNISECWHFDYPGIDWENAYKKLPYSEIAKCATLDVGEWDPSEDKDKVKNMLLQSQLIRLGFYEIGKVDGVIGTKTKLVLSKFEHSNIEYLISV